MATKKQKKERIRNQIVTAAQVYSQSLAGKKFLYVYGEEYFEVLFSIDGFLHLTGVETYLNAKNFYRKSKNGKLDVNQFYFTSIHPLNNAKKKLLCLNRLPELTNTMVCIVKNVTTITITYIIGITNLEFTLGLMEHFDKNGNKIDDAYIPRTLRVKDNSVDISSDGDIVDFVFSKDASVSTYSDLLVKDKYKSVPDCIHHLIDEKYI